LYWAELEKKSDTVHFEKRRYSTLATLADQNHPVLAGQVMKIGGCRLSRGGQQHQNDQQQRNALQTNAREHELMAMALIKIASVRHGNDSGQQSARCG